MLNFEEYNATFNCNLSKDSFDAIELIFVDPDTHEKVIFKRVREEDE